MRLSRARTQWARRLYPDPEPVESVEENTRLIHADLATMDTAEINRELGLARLRALGDDEPSDWLRERLRELETALLKAYRHNGAGDRR
jgi:hypothetical protein